MLLIVILRLKNVNLLLPNDIVLGDAFDANANSKIINVGEAIPENWMGLDIGPESITTFNDCLANSETVVWNGPMGVFEDSEFATGTNEVFIEISKSDGMTVVGGGETAMAFNQMGLADGIRHISTGGGACISFMSGETMPALEAMRRSKNKFNK